MTAPGRSQCSKRSAPGVLSGPSLVQAEAVTGLQPLIIETVVCMPLRSNTALSLSRDHTAYMAGRNTGVPTYILPPGPFKEMLFCKCIGIACAQK